MIADSPLANARDPGATVSKSHRFTLVLAGNPNAGKTTLFNALTGLRAKTANFPGTTIECRIGRAHIGGQPVTVVDLPGLYSLDSSSPEEQVAAQAVRGRLSDHSRADAVLLIVDATNLERNLFLVSQILELQVPTVVALNMMDMAEEHGLQIDPAKLQLELGCPVIPISARYGTGLDMLHREIARLAASVAEPVGFVPPKPACTGCSGCPFQARYAWTEDVSSRCVAHAHETRGRRTEKIDQVLTHPVIGVAAFFAVMFGIFFLIFQVAKIPMNLIDGFFAYVATFAAQHLPEGLWSSLLVNGVIRGVGGILVFLPQIGILFFLLSLIEDTGYFARAAFVMDRLMRRIGLPGKAFVPLLSAHACALPAIMSTRVIEDRRDRLVTILVAPLMTCSARIPVYTMLIALLFARSPIKASLTFTGAYAVGVAAALTMAWVFRHTILPGESKPLVLELPHYRLPSLRTATLQMLDRAAVFIRSAGTVILCISVGLWFLASFPRIKAPSPTASPATKVEAARDQLEHSIAGRLGHSLEPVLRPLGFDWQIGIGVITSFAAREVIVSTLAVVYGVGSDVAEEHPDSLYDTLRDARRSDGKPVFNTANCFSLLVFYILAAQCLPTQAVTRRETGTWKWPLLQIAYMTGLAYLAAFGVFQVLRHFGFA
ncbi:MAG TPA: ferrous iron transporter B [Verrucomicrobiae bacterium]|nr:ferrous iron transporter B [Verrucomicrobiae bacterium]